MSLGKEEGKGDLDSERRKASKFQAAGRNPQPCGAWRRTT